MRPPVPCTRRPGLRLVVAASLVVGLTLAGCGGDEDGGTGSTTTDESSSSTVAESTTRPGGGSTTTDGDGTTSTTDGGGSGSTSSSTTVPPFAGDQQPDTGEADGTGTALLVGARLGAQPGFTRFVLEMQGETRPGWNARWVDGPITEDPSDAPVTIAGDAYLQIVVNPASGYDVEAGTPTYDGPRRIAGPAGGSVREAVQTGDFEAVLTWVLGADGPRDFRVQWLGSPSRIVVDVADS